MATDTKVAPAELTGDALATEIKKRWDEAGKKLSVARRNYWSNCAFFHDEQWIDWDGTRRQIVALPRGEDRMRFTNNQFRPNLTNLLAKHTQNLLRFNISPQGPDDGVIAGARLGEDWLAHISDDQDWEALRYDALLAAYFGGTSAIAVDWDPTRGEVVESQTGKARMGEADLSMLPITEFCLYPITARRARDATAWIRGVAIDSEEVKRRYNLEHVPVKDASEIYSPLQQQLLAEIKGQDDPGTPSMTLVLTMYERPDPLSGFAGRVTTVVGEHVVDDGITEWPFPFDHLNLETFRETKVENQWWGDTMLNTARPVQVALNHFETMIGEHGKKVGNARKLVPDISLGLNGEQTDLPGEVEVYDSEGPPPSWMSPPDLPRWMLQKIGNLKEDLDNIFSRHAVSKGVNPVQGDASGIALALLAEKDDTPLNLIAKDQRARWTGIGRMVLKLYEQKAEKHGKRNGTVSVGPYNRSIVFDSKRLAGQTRVSVPIDAVSPESPVARRAFAMDLHTRGLLTTAREVLRVANMPDQDRLIQAVDPDAAKAIDENWAFEIGRVADAPADFDDHPTHIAEHNRLRKSGAYRAMSDQGRADVDDHVLAHEAMERDQLARQQQTAAVDPLQALAAQADQPPGSMVPLDSQQVPGESPGTQGFPPADQAPPLPGVAGLEGG